MSLIQLSEDEFETQFMPVENLEQGQGVYQFDAYDAKDSGFLQFMAINHPTHVWTRIDGDDGCLYNINGWHIVNRIDYIVTEVPWLKNHDYEVQYFTPYQ
jgi:hypothetical protein